MSDVIVLEGTDLCSEELNLEFISAAAGLLGVREPKALKIERLAYEAADDPELDLEDLIAITDEWAFHMSRMLVAHGFDSEWLGVGGFRIWAEEV